MKVQPHPGCILRDPVSRIPLPPEGKEVPNNSFWRRRVKAGDVMLVTAPAFVPASAPAPAEPPEEKEPVIEETLDEGTEQPTQKTKSMSKKKGGQK